jgi:preprotein translocase subunit SecA
VRLKFRIEIKPEDLAGQAEEQVKAVICQKVRELYRQKEVEFPVQAAVVRFLGDKTPSAAGPRYDRAGLFVWAKMRFPGVSDNLSEDEFRTQPKSRLQELVMDLSRRYYPQTPQEAIDAKLDEAFEGAQKSEAGDAAELVEWFKANYQIDVPAEALTSVTQDTARQLLWNTFDDKYRPEMRGLERSLLLARIDDAWKKHLLTMDHLRSGIGLVGYAQVDPKTEYKREGMKAFDEMWSGVQDKITEAVFRMEEEAGFTEVVGFARHEEAPRFVAGADGSDGTTTNAAQSDKKPEPIRNATDRVGRNDPCPCGSGKKYKNCCMRQPVK